MGSGHETGNLSGVTITRCNADNDPCLCVNDKDEGSTASKNVLGVKSGVKEVYLSREIPNLQQRKVWHM